MNLVLLRQSPQLAIYFDSWNNWLFLDWQGALTLPGVQAAALALVQCSCAYPYQRVLNSNANVTDVSPSATEWLSHELLPYMQQAGVEQIAWVFATNSPGRQMVQQLLRAVTHPLVATFDELEAAVEWLQHTQPPYPVNSQPPRPEALPTQSAAFISRVKAQLMPGRP